MGDAKLVPPSRVVDFTKISPATRLLDKRRQMFEVIFYSSL